MELAKLTYKGQITIPLAIRNMLGLKTGDKVYFEAFSLLGLLSPELVKNSTFPMVLLALTNSPHRTKYISEKELEAKLTEILGANWRDFLYEYKKKLKGPPQTTQEIDEWNRSMLSLDMFLTI